VKSCHNVFIKDISSTTPLIDSSNWSWSITSNLSQEAQVFLRFIYQHKSNLDKDSQLRPSARRNSIRRSKSAGNANDISVSQFKIPLSDGQHCSTYTHATDSALHQTTSSDAVDCAKGPAPIPEMMALFKGAIGPQFWKSVKHRLQAFLRIEDTGGQPELMEMLPALTIGPGFYFLFCKLTDSLNSHYSVSYRSQSGEATVPVPSTNTVEEQILSALSSISCMSSYSTRSNGEDSPSSLDKIFKNSSKSVAYVIGTHKDEATEDQIEQLDHDLQKSLKSTDFYKKGLVQFHSPGKLIIPIDNVHGGQSEVDYLRKLIQEALRRHFKKLRIPVSWFAFSLCLRSKKKRVTTLKSCLELGQSLGMKDYETRVALLFLHHHAGILMHFPDIPQLHDLVITDPQLMYDSVTSLILNAFKFGHMNTAAAEKFKNTGQFTIEDLEMVTAEVSGDYLSAKQLVLILEHLNIVAVIQGACSYDEEVTYLMPSVLQSAPREVLEAISPSYPSQPKLAPLMIQFKCGFVPIGVFSALMANLMSKKSFKVSK